MDLMKKKDAACGDLHKEADLPLTLRSVVCYLNDEPSYP